LVILFRLWNDFSDDSRQRCGFVLDGDRAANGFVHSCPTRKRRPLPIYSMMGGSMVDLVNFNRFKKRAEREAAAKLADANRARFGRTKSQRALDDHHVSRANQLLDQHTIGGEDAS
jgi:hypothetical protein